MYLKGATITDFSTGKSYRYSDKSGSWKSITSEGGRVGEHKGEPAKSVEPVPPVSTPGTSSFTTPTQRPSTPNTHVPSSTKSTSVPSGSSGSVRPSATSVSEHPLFSPSSTVS